MSKQPGRGPEEARQWLIENQGAFEKWPKIEALSDLYGFHVTGQVTGPKNPLPIIITTGLNLISLVVGAVGGFQIEVAVFGESGGFWWLAGIATIVATANLNRNLGRIIGGTKIDVIITPEKIGVGRMFKYEWIERRFGAAFELVRPHSKAHEIEVDGFRLTEKDRNFYRESDEVIVTSGVRRLSVAGISKDKKRAEKLHMALFLLNQAVN